jgi:SAM-dependent methyltransferase
LPPQNSGRPATVLDVGCGPGRLTAAVTNAGARAIGIDISGAAVALTRARGMTALRADVFGAVLRPGGWDRVLLADGNLGIGGDPVTLLRRAAQLVAPGGRVIADVEPTGRIRRAQAWIEATRPGPAGPERIGGSLPWAWIGVDAVAELTQHSGLTLHSLSRQAERCVVVWERPASW